MGNGWVLLGYLVTFGGIAAYILRLAVKARAFRSDPEP